VKKKVWQESNNKKAISFFRAFIRMVLMGRFQVVQWGWWPAGVNGKYGMSLFWKNLDEAEEEDG
jgi:hypothetical protein